jgi:hypothetical protein
VILLNSEQGLKSLIKATKLLTSTRDLDEVLNLLINEVLQVIKQADGAVFFIYDKKSDQLVPKSSAGFDMDFLKLIHLNPNEGMTGKTFTSKKAQVFSTKNDTSDGMSNLHTKNQELYQQSLGSLQYPTSTICAPLLSNDECIGVLTIDSFSEDVLFTELDLSLLQTFANQAIIAIENAKLFTQITRSNQIHNELTNVYIAQKGLPEITLSLSKLINKPVCVYNEFFDLLAFSSPYVEKLAGEAKSEYFSLFKRSFSKDIVSHEQIEIEGRVFDLYFFPIKAEKVKYGMLTIFLEKNQELDPLDLLAVEQATMVFALEMISQDRYITDYFKYEGYILEQLLEAPANGYHLLQDSKFQLSKRNSFVFVYMEISDAYLRFSELKTIRQKFSRLIYRELKYFKYKSLVVEAPSQYKILFMIDEFSPEDEVVFDVTNLLNRIAEKGKLRIDCGLGRVFKQIEDVRLSLHDSIKCVEYLKKVDAGKSVYSYHELGIKRFFLNLDEKELHDFSYGRIGALINYDHANQTELLFTLKSYLECNQNITETAAKSFVHINTIKYRLEKIKKLLNEKELSGKKLFDLQLAIYIYEYLQEK